MGLAMEVISGYATNASTTFTAITMATGDSATVRNFNQNSQAYLLDNYAQGATKGYTRVISPRMHDNVNGITMAYAATTPVPLYSQAILEPLYPQDALGLYLTGGASETDVVSWLVYYKDLPGTSARLYNWEDIQPRILHTSGCQLAITPGGTAGTYGGSVAINNTATQFKANTDYAIIGGVTDTAWCTVGIKSADFGNLRVGMPATNNKIENRDYFYRLNRRTGLPCIPVFNAANVANTTVDLITTATGTAGAITFLLAELATPGGATA